MYEDSMKYIISTPTVQAVRTMAGTLAAGISTEESQAFQRLSSPPQAEAKVSLPEVLVIN